MKSASLCLPLPAAATRGEPSTQDCLPGPKTEWHKALALLPLLCAACSRPDWPHSQDHLSGTPAALYLMESPKFPTGAIEPDPPASALSLMSKPTVTL